MRQALIAVSLLVGSALLAQQGSPNASSKAKQYVTYVAEDQQVKAGKPSVIALSFKVTDGYHVNSHTPRSELLIPTSLALKPVTGLTAVAAVYPAGTSYSFSFEPNEKLDVYTGTFTVKVPVTAVAGTHSVEGVLHYQACDNAACYPPKNLPVTLTVTAK